MKKNILKTILGITFLFLAVAPFVQAGQTWFYFESDTSANSMTVTQGESINFVLTASSHNNIPLDWEKIEAIQGSNTYLLQSWNEQGTKTGTSYIFAETYVLDTGILNPNNYMLKFSALTNTGVEYSELNLIITPHVVDNTAPVVTITSPADGVTYTSHRTSLTFTATDENLQSCGYSLNGGQRISVSCSNGVSKTISGISSVEGANTWTVYAEDKAGNSGSDSVTFVVDFGDTTAPAITSITPTEGVTYTSSRMELDIVVNEEVKYIEYSLDGKPNVEMNRDELTAYSYTLTGLENGEHAITFYTEDLAGNTAELTVNFQIEIPEDTTAPVITILGDNPAQVLINTNYADAGATAWDNVDGNLTDEVIVTSNINTSVLGQYSVIYEVEDNAENTAQETRIVYVVEEIDTEAPVITVITPEEKKYGDDELTFEISVNEECTSVEYSLDSGNNVSMTEAGTLVFSSEEIKFDDGDYTVTFYATDLSGNTASISVDFEIDTEKKEEKKKTYGDAESSYELEKYLNQNKPKKAVIELTDEEPIIKLKWWQRFINWIVQLFGGNAVY